VVEKAYGKLNLSLDITGRRDDGYHYVSMLMQSVELCDFVTVLKNDTGTLTVTCDNPDIPNGKDNLAYRALELMKDTCSLSCGFDVSIEKHIPVAGGMAGGSTDAAAVLRAVNTLCDLNLSQEKLMEIGLKLGADVPFCVQKAPALATGIGEILTPVTGLSDDLCILLVNPNVALSTKAIYDIVDNTLQSGCVDNDALVLALKNGDIRKAARYMQNVMQTASNSLCGEISGIITRIQELGAIHAMMSGSGATCFGIFKEKPDIKNAEAIFSGCFVSLTKPLSIINS